MQKLDADTLFKVAVAAYAEMARVEDTEKVWTLDDIQQAMSFNTTTNVLANAILNKSIKIPATKIGMPRMDNSGQIELELVTVYAEYTIEQWMSPHQTQIIMYVDSDDFYTKEIRLHLTDDRNLFRASEHAMKVHLAIGAIVGWRFLVMSELSQIASTPPTCGTRRKKDVHEERINITTLIRAVRKSLNEQDAIIKMFDSPVTGVNWIEHSLVDESKFVEGSDERYVDGDGVQSVSRKYSMQRAIGCTLPMFLEEMKNLHSGNSVGLDKYVDSDFAVALPDRCIIVPSLSKIIEQVDEDEHFVEPSSPKWALGYIIECVLPRIPITSDQCHLTYEFLQAVGIPEREFKLEWEKDQISTERLYLNVCGSSYSGDDGDPEKATISTPDEYDSLATNPKPDMQKTAPTRLRLYQDILTHAAKMYQNAIEEWDGEGADTSYTFEEAVVMAILMVVYPSAYEVPIPFSNLCHCGVIEARAYEPVPVYNEEIINGPPREA